MNVLVDIILVFAFAYFVFKYSKLGLIISVLRFGKPIAALLIALSIGSIFANIIFGILSLQIGVETRLVMIISPFLGHVSVFVISLILITMLVNIISSVKIPIISKIDKVLGAILGVFIGFVVISALSTGVFSFLNLMHNFVGDSAVMQIYHDSFVFKNVYNLRFFEFIKELI